MIRITVNGDQLHLEDGAFVAEILLRRDVRDLPCAVEVNRAVVSHRNIETHQLHDGDVVEIVTLVGGG